MTEKDSDSFQREELINDQLLHTEYQEANQEFRHRNQLLHNTFYLLIIATVLFLGLFIRFGLNGDLVALGVLLIPSGIASTFIGHLFLKHFHERSSAEAVRRHAEWIANGEQETAQKALSLEWGVAGGGAKYDEENDRIVRRGSHIHYLDITERPNQLLSAESVGLSLVYLGAAALVMGSGLASLSFVTELFSVVFGAILTIVILFVYKFARKEARSPDDDPIY